MVEVVSLDASLATPIGERPYEIRHASALTLAGGDGEAHAYVVHFEAGGVIGPHEAGFGQLFVALAGSGWVAGADGERMPLPTGHAGFIRRGEVHSKGSEVGMTALMVQVRELELVR